MKKSAIALVAAALSFGPQAAKAGTLGDVKSRGVLNCIVSTGLPGFSYTDASGRWKGFDDRHHRLVIHELAAIHLRLRHQRHRQQLLDTLAEHIAR